ncbi:ESX secretion-associated protein EspG [Amycolatopsis sp. NPDC051045]|uniref:ESX secretion-associated protein EspG n=1 Tax=Amycolatopsis sp. NPDC051045 TaxID=3156922 RepID=UPI0034130A22
MLNAVFSLNTLLTAMRNVGCGEPHAVFAKGLRYIPPSAARRVDREAFEELSPYGFTQGDGFTPEFEDVLHLIDRPAQEFFGYARDETVQQGILVAAKGRTAVSVVCRGDQVELASLSPDTHPADALVAHVPPASPADIRPFSLSQEEFRNKPAVSDIFDDAPARSREAQELDALFQQPYYGVGQLQTKDKIVSYLDLDAGRVGIALADGYISVLPGHPQEMSRKLK